MVIALLIGAAAAVATPAKPDAGKVKYNSIFPVNVPESVLEPIRGEMGVWDADVELYVGDPAKQPIRKKGVQTNRLVSKDRHMLNAKIPAVTTAIAISTITSTRLCCGLRSTSTLETVSLDLSSDSVRPISVSISSRFLRLLRSVSMSSAVW